MLLFWKTACWLLAISALYPGDKTPHGSPRALACLWHVRILKRGCLSRSFIEVVYGELGNIGAELSVCAKKNVSVYALREEKGTDNSSFYTLIDAFSKPLPQQCSKIHMSKGCTQTHFSFFPHAQIFFTHTQILYICTRNFFFYARIILPQ